MLSTCTITCCVVRHPLPRALSVIVVNSLTPYLLPLQLFVYQQFGGSSLITNIILQFIAGAFVNGPYALITTAVAADLGNTVTSSKAMATVTAIIDGTGSIGAAVGPLLAGLVSTSGWNNVFYMVYVSDLISLLMLLRIGRNEWRKLRNRSRAIH